MKDLQALINKCKNKDSRSEYDLYKACFTLLIGICMRYSINKDDAVDLLNKGFLKILNNIHKYEESKPFEKWAKTILVNTIIDEFRKNRNYKSFFVEKEIEAISPSEHPFDLNDAEGNLSSREILSEIQKLPEGCREVLNLFVFEGLNHKEISEHLQITQSTSRWHLAKARALLKIRFEKLLSSVKMMIL